MQSNLVLGNGYTTRSGNGIGVSYSHVPYEIVQMLPFYVFKFWIFKV